MRLVFCLLHCLVANADVSRAVHFPSHHDLLQEELDKVMTNVQQLLPLLTICVASQESTQNALADLKLSLDQTEATTRGHMEQLAAVMAMLVNKDSVAEVDLKKAVAGIQQSTHRLAEGDLHEVKCLCANVHSAVTKDIKQISEAVAGMQLLSRKTLAGVSHQPTIAICRNNIGSTLRDLGRHEEALDEFKAALDIHRAIRGEHDPLVASSRSCIGCTLNELGRHQEALVEQRAALDIHRAVRGEQHEFVAVSHNNISMTLKQLDRHEEALVEQRAALDIHRAVLGENDECLATDRDNIGMTLIQLGRHEEALVEQRTALDICCAQLGGLHPSIARRRDSVLSTLKKLGRYDEALAVKLDIDVANIRP